MQSRGARVLRRNVRLAGGELDLVVAFAGERVAVEVKTTTVDSSGDAIFHFGDKKLRQVRLLANTIGVRRVDYVGVELSATAATVRWLPGVC